MAIYYDSFSCGLVPVKPLRIEHDIFFGKDVVVCDVTRTTGAYPKGYQLRLSFRTIVEKAGRSGFHQLVRAVGQSRVEELVP